MTTLGRLVQTAAAQGNPLDALRVFLEREDGFEKARQIDRMRFVGYVLELGYETAKIITSDPYKLAVGGIPRGSFLIMTPVSAGGAPLHFTLLRVTGVSPTPLSNQVQQTYPVSSNSSISKGMLGVLSQRTPCSEGRLGDSLGGLGGVGLDADPHDVFIRQGISHDIFGHGFPCL